MPLTLLALLACGTSAPRSGLNVSDGVEHDVVAPRSGGTQDTGGCGSTTPACGEFDWALLIQSTDNDKLNDIAVAPDGNLVVVGEYARDVTLGAGTPDALTLPEGCGTVTWEGLVASFAPDGTIQWAQQITSCNDVWTEAVAVASDGTIHAIGRFQDDITLGHGQVNETTVPGAGLFFAAYTADGELIRVAKAASSGFFSRVSDATVLDDGGVVATGRFKDPLVFDQGGPHETTLEVDEHTTLLFPASDAWTAALDADYAFRWARRDGGPSFSSSGWGVASSGSDLMFGVQSYVYDFSLDAGLPTETLMSPESGKRVPLGRLDTESGLVQWAEMTGGAGATDLASVADGVLVSGTVTLSETSTFGEGQPNETTLSQGHFVARYSTEGQLVWASGTAQGGAFARAVDANENYAAVGGFLGVPEIMVSECGPTFQWDGNQDVAGYAATYDLVDGAFLCAWRFGGFDRDDVTSVAIGPDNAVYVVGEFEGDLTFGEGLSGQATLQAVSSDGFIARFSPP